MKKSSTMRALLLSSLQDFQLVIVFLSSCSCIFGVFCSGSFKEC
ncbi:unnamed protein product [Brassica oleracea]